MTDEKPPSEILADIETQDGNGTERHIRKVTAEFFDEEWSEIIDPAFAQFLVATQNGEDVDAAFKQLASRLRFVLRQMLAYSDALDDVDVEEYLDIEYEIE